MNFVDHVVWRSRAKHPYKRTTTKLWFYYGIGNHLDDSIAPIFWSAFLHKTLTWLLKVSLLSVVIPTIFSSLLLLKMKLLKIKCHFPYPYQGTSSNIYRHLEPYYFLQTILKRSENQNAICSLSLSEYNQRRIRCCHLHNCLNMNLKQKERERSLMKMLNNNGPNIELWRTPAIMFSQVLKLLFTWTFCCLLVK